jgi:plasmid stabilization system protein ParE
VVRSTVLHEAADAEALEAYDWYAQRNPAAAEGFRIELRDAIDRIAERPELAPPFDGDVRRSLLRGYPYGVLYEVGPEAVVVLAIMHLRRAPGYWRDR